VTLPQMPKTLDLGFGELVELSYLETVFGLTRRAASKYLKVLRIEPIYVGKDVYFSLSTFKRIIFVLTRPGGPGMVMPASLAKNNPRKIKDPNCTFGVTDEILEQAANPAILAEMLASDGRNPNIIKQFIKNRVGRPTKDAEDEQST